MADLSIIRSKCESEALQSTANDNRFRMLARALGDDAELYVVGGTVRDALRGVELRDLDLASRLSAEQLVVRLERAGVRVIPTGLAHQTVTAVPCPEEGAVEITTFRASYLREDSDRSLHSIDEDLKLRDFTINALAYDPRLNEIVSPERSLEDIESKIVRAVGEARERFTEDPHRVLRLVRFSCLPGFSSEPATLAAAFEQRELLNSVAIERIREEFNLILTSVNPELGIRMLEELEFFKSFLPEVQRYVEFEQNSFHKADLFNHTIEVVAGCPPDLVLRLAALLHDVGKPDTLSVDELGERHFYRHESVGADMVSDILKRFKYPNSVQNDVATLVRTHMRPLDAGPGGLRRLLRDTAELYPSWRELKEADATACKIDSEQIQTELAKFDDAIAEVKLGPEVSPLASLAISGEDLIGLGMTPGPEFGEILHKLHERVLDNPEYNTRECLLELVPEVQAELGDAKNL